jgi:hypothetical protein
MSMGVASIPTFPYDTNELSHFPSGSDRPTNISLATSSTDPIYSNELSHYRPDGYKPTNEGVVTRPTDPYDTNELSYFPPDSYRPTGTNAEGSSTDAYDNNDFAGFSSLDYNNPAFQAFLASYQPPDGAYEPLLSMGISESMITEANTAMMYNSSHPFLSGPADNQHLLMDNAGMLPEPGLLEDS